MADVACFSGRNCRVYRPSSRRVAVVAAAVKNAKRAKYQSSGPGSSKGPVIVTVAPDGSDAWKMDQVVEMINQGAVGIIPTDTLPSIVCDLENSRAVQRLYQAKEMNPKKPLSILCKDFTQISYYTAGFPASSQPGHPNWFKVARGVLPGPYTLILPATKNLPSQMIDFMKGTTIHRKSVGVRIPDDRVCMAVLERLERPLLCTSVHVPKHLTKELEVPDVGQMLEEYVNKGIDFIVDVGPRVVTYSTVVDMTGAVPEIVREGCGDPSVFETE